MKTLLPLFLLPLFLTGCATLIGGYEQNVVIANMNDSTQVYDTAGAPMQVLRKHNIRLRTADGRQHLRHDSMNDIPKEYVAMLESKYGPMVMVYDAEVRVRRDRDLRLRIVHDGTSTDVHQFRTVGLHWFFLDVLTGGIGFVLDAYTGNWTEFSDIDARSPR